MRKLVLLPSLFLSIISCGQELKRLEPDLKSKLEIISIDTGAGAVRLPTSLPLFSFELNKTLYRSDDTTFTNNILHKLVSITVQFDPGFHDGIKATIGIKNISGSVMSVSNIIPFGTNAHGTYISGMPLSDTSRTFLFEDNRAPVGVIVPHNNNDLSFCSVPLTQQRSLYGLLRRTNDSIQNYLQIRTPYRLQPSDSITFYLYADLAEGDWHEALKKCFQRKMLYEVNKFDNRLYERKDLAWIRDAYTMHLMMGWDRDYYDAADSCYHLQEFLSKMKSLYGGDDIFAIWPTWPVLGLDGRSQWDLMRDLPGGLPQQKKLIDRCHTQGTRYFISYNPWDDASEKDALHQMSRIIADIDADGVVLDTKAEAGRTLQDAADRAKAGVILYSEGMAVPKDMQGIISGRVHNDIYYPPLLNLNKLIKPEFAIFRVAEISRERIRREYATAFFNGYGMEINVMRPGRPQWVDDDYRFWGRCARILKENSDNFHSSGLVMLVPALHDSIYVNKWPGVRKTVYTVFSLFPRGYRSPLFRAEQKPGYHYIDLWKNDEAAIDTVAGKSYIRVETAPFDEQYLGTNNEGAVSAIAQLPDLLNVWMAGDRIFIQAKAGTLVRLWQDNPSYDSTYLDMRSLDTSFHLFKVFGRTEGKYVIQLFEGTDLLDERVIFLKPGTPLLISDTTRTKPVLSAPDGMVRIPAGLFTMSVKNGDEFISYPKDGYPATMVMKSYYMDKYPVTNAEFEHFLDASGYHPADTVNFLRQWIAGKIPAGKEHFPVVDISYDDALAYAKWAGKRLPTEAEWQYAGQAGDGRMWPWGNEVKQQGNVSRNISSTLTLVDYGEPDSTYCNPGDGRSYPVGKYPKGASPFGVQDMVGSVWQLTGDRYQNDSYDYIILKGGSFYKPAGSWWFVQGGPKPLPYRQMLLRVSPGFERNDTVGFRCVMDAE